MGLNPGLLLKLYICRLLMPATVLVFDAVRVSCCSGAAPLSIDIFIGDLLESTLLVSGKKPGGKSFEAGTDNLRILLRRALRTFAVLLFESHITWVSLATTTFCRLRSRLLYFGSWDISATLGLKGSIRL